MKKSKEIISKPVKLNKADIKITSKLMNERSENKILEKSMKLIEKIIKANTLVPTKRQNLLPKRKKLIKKSRIKKSFLLMLKPKLSTKEFFHKSRILFQNRLLKTMLKSANCNLLSKTQKIKLRLPKQKSLL